MHISKMDLLLLVFSGLIFLVPMASGLYFAVVFLRAPYRRPKPLPTSVPVTRFVVLVPACNEERVIRRALDSIHNLDYPRELLDVIVVADNCTDATAAIAKACGARVLERFDPVRRSKAHAMRWAFYDQGLLEAGYDAICIIDADNIVSPFFLRHIESRFQEGHAVIHGRCELINPQETFVSSFMALFVALGNRMYRFPTEDLGISTLYSGTGVAIRCDHIKHIGWDIISLTEDMEFSLHTILSGKAVRYCDEAEFHAEQPEDAATIWSQQRRWMSGNIVCGRLLFGKFVNRCMKVKDASAFMGFFTLLLPYACIAGLLQMVLGPVLSVVLIGPQVLSPVFILVCLLYAQLSGMASAAIILALNKNLRWRMWKGILCFSLCPIFFGVIATVSLFSPKRSWELIQHGLVKKVKITNPSSTEA